MRLQSLIMIIFQKKNVLEHLTLRTSDFAPGRDAELGKFLILPDSSESTESVCLGPVAHQDDVIPVTSGHDGGDTGLGTELRELGQRPRVPTRGSC